MRSRTKGALPESTRPTCSRSSSNASALDLAAAGGQIRGGMSPRARLLSLLLLSSCAGAFTYSTEALVARFEQGPKGWSLRMCRVSLGWTRAELVSRCGAPLRIVKSLATDQTDCAIYETAAAPLHTAVPGAQSSQSIARYYAVCLAPPRGRRETEDQVDSVAGLVGLPRALTSTASR